MKNLISWKFVLSLSCFALAFANLYFYRPQSIMVPWLPKVVWLLLISAFLGLILASIILSSTLKKSVTHRPRKSTIFFLVLAIPLSALMLFFSKAELTQNRLTAVTFEILLPNRRT
ncbi:MAG: hypothetical protein AB9891_20640 [Anaerolineaceae bacterium]